MHFAVYMMIECRMFPAGCTVHLCDSAGSWPPDTLALRLLPQLCYNLERVLVMQGGTEKELHPHIP